MSNPLLSKSVVVFPRIAMRKNGVLTYLHSDHLGSTVLETNASGAVINDQKYKAYGKPRDTGIVGTDFQFTGQKQDASGLQYFNARYYDPQIGLFVSPDSIVPDPGRVLAYNRYLYARANPLRFADPTGHSDILPGIPNPFEWLMHLLGLNTDSIEATGTPEFQDLDTNIGEDVYSTMKPAGEALYTASDFAAGFMPGYGLAKGVSGINPDGSELSTWERFFAGTTDMLEMGTPFLFLNHSATKSLSQVISDNPATSGRCVKCAREVYDIFTKNGFEAQIGQLTSNTPKLTTKDGVILSTNNAFHQFVKVGDFVFDALTGSRGMHWNDYKKLFYDGVFEDGTIVVTFSD